ncbi:hypothetical protein MUK42_35166 [Musa troglodytarum]|uniref:Uncharacterized protein n=1 Tax=Musa troglodytarum TaxID=320322 RepID=A0A9E7JYE2_9LILI|nr:hypothetical protein MUK42_35166 [Musa troglodytarum]
MTGDCVAALHPTASGRPEQATSVLLRLIGAAAAFAILPKGSRRSIGGAGKAKRVSGKPSSETSIVLHLNM